MTYISQPHELELWEDSLDDAHQEVHCVNVNERVLLDVTVLHFDGDDLAGRFESGSVHLGKACHAQRLLVEVRKHFKRLKKTLITVDLFMKIYNVKKGYVAN